MQRVPETESQGRIHTSLCTVAVLPEVEDVEIEIDKNDLEIDVYRSSFRPMKHTLTGRDETTMMKLIVERGGVLVVGCHMVGPDAGEITQGLAIALKCGATKAQFDATIGIHPTAAEEFVTMREKLPDPGTT